MFSNRLPWPHRENRLTEALRRRREAGKPVLDLTESNPTRAGLVSRAAEIAAALSPPAVTYAPDPRGLTPAREAVAAWLGARGREIPPDHLILTSSTSEAYSHLFKVLCEPGDSVLVPIPSYPLFEHLARLDAVRAVPYHLDAEHDWRLDSAALESALDSSGRPRAVIVVNPNNPTGTAFRAAERDFLDRLCAARGVAVISDEVFFEFLFASGEQSPAARASAAKEGPPVSFAAASRPEALTFTLGGLSKAGGLPQMKLGWIAATGPEPTRDEALERLVFVADAYLSVGTPVQLAASRLLEIGDGNARRIADRVRGNLTWLGSLLHPDSPCRLLPGDGGWSAVLRVPAVRSEEELVLLLLEEDGVLVHPGYFFDFPGEAYLVLSLLPESDAFREGVERVLGRVSA